jgi:D-alanyl-D-alanine carboxypeptidase/D-alanyl-D-alanine-endopeptidase (penicillin-binding protein 4)
VEKTMKLFRLLFFIFPFISSHTFCQNISGDSILISKVLPMLTDSSWQGGIIAITAKDLKDNKVLIDFNGNYKLNPASILKLITTGAALHILGPDFRFKTEIGYTGTIQDSVLNGNIIIKGYGDPTLYSSYFSTYYKKNNPFDSLAILLKNKGIKIVHGKIIGDATFFDYNLPTSTWIVGDIANYFGASPCALSIFDDEYSLYFATADTIAPAHLLSMKPTDIPIEIINQLKGGKVTNDQSIIYGDIFDSTRLVTGFIPLKSDSFEVRGSLPNPPAIAALTLRNKLKEYQIDVNDSVLNRFEYNYKPDTSKKFQLLITHYSPTLADIINITNLYSINLFAEHIARLCGYTRYKSTTTEMGALAIHRFWQKYTGNMLLYDASGLSRFNAISTQQFVSVLDYMYTKSSYKKIFYNSLPVAGESGTLTKMFAQSKAKGKIVAKTGTMSNIRSLAGYINTDKKHVIAFTIIVNNCPLPSKLIKQKIEEIILKLFFE